MPFGEISADLAFIPLRTILEVKLISTGKIDDHSFFQSIAQGFDLFTVNWLTKSVKYDGLGDP